MRLVRTLLMALVVAVFSAAASGFAATTEISLVLPVDSAKPGDTVMAGFVFKIKSGWHVYWRNPGEFGGIATGEAPEIKWTLPPGVTAGEIQWPVPGKLVEKAGDTALVNYIFTNSVTLLAPLKIAADAKPGEANLTAVIHWQECSDVCVIGRTTNSVKLAIGSESRPSFDEVAIQSALRRLPQPDTNMTAGARWEKDGQNRRIIIEWPGAGKIADADFYPYVNTNYSVDGETERLPDDAGKVVIRKKVTKSGADWPSSVEGLLVTKPDGDGASKAVAVTLQLPPLAASAAAPTATGDSASLAVMLVFAVIGGLILNIMPCVLPVIALKVLGFVNQARETPGRVRQLGLVYGLGVLFSFLVLACVEIAAQRAGGVASWSTALQNQHFRILITVLITLVALNLFGVFEVTLSGGAMNAAGGLASKHGFAGAFFNGMLATILATPCTAPFLATAVGYAFTQPPASVVLIFLAVGVGLALPFVLLCWQPGWLKILPRPGKWMERFKVAMGFPMLATALWLFWATAGSMGDTGVLRLGLFLVVLALAAWIWGEFVQRGMRGRGLAAALSVLCAAGGYYYTLAASSGEGVKWDVWSSAAVDQARSDGRPVLVDFTGKLCLNCKLDEGSIDAKGTLEKLKELNFATLRGDYTDEDPVIGRELQKFGRPGVPLVLVYPPGKDKEPIVLPPLFSSSTILDALAKAAGK